MVYNFAKHIYEFTDKSLKVDGKFCKSRASLYFTIMSVLKHAGYSFEWPERPVPPLLQHWHNNDGGVTYCALLAFARNVLTVLCGCSPDGLQWLQACKLTPSGCFYTLLDDRKVFAYECYDRYHHLVQTGATYHLDEIESLVHDGTYVTVR